MLVVAAAVAAVAAVADVAGVAALAAAVAAAFHAVVMCRRTAAAPSVFVRWELVG